MFIGPAPAADLEELREMVAEVLDQDPAVVTDHALFVQELGVDSLIALELAVTLERHYGVRFDEAEILRMRCLGDVHGLLTGKQAAAR